MVIRTRTRNSHSRSTNNKTSESNNKDLLLQTNKSSVHKYNRNKELKQSSDLQGSSVHRRRSSIKSTSSTDNQEIFSMLDPIESHRKNKNIGQQNKNQRRNNKQKKKKKIIYDEDDKDDWSNSNSESERSGSHNSSNPYLTESASLFSESSSSFNYDDDDDVVIKAPTRKEKEQQQQQERLSQKSIKSSKGKTAVQDDENDDDDEQIMVTKSFSFSSRNNKPKSTKTKTKTKIIKKKEKNPPKKKNMKTSSSRRGQDVVVEQKEMSEDDKEENEDDESIDNKKTSSSTKSLLQQKSLSLLCNSLSNKSVNDGDHDDHDGDTTPRKSRSRTNSTGSQLSHGDHIKLIQDKFATKAEPQAQPPSSNRSIQLTDIMLTSSSSLYDNTPDKKKKNSKKKKKSSHDNDDIVHGGVEIMTDEKKKKEKKSKKSSHDHDDEIGEIGVDDEVDDSGMKMKKEKKAKKKSKSEKKKKKKDKKKKKSKKSKKKKKKKSKSKSEKNDSNLVNLNISGTKTTVLRKTLTSVPGSMLSLLFASTSISSSSSTSSSSSESESERSKEEDIKNENEKENYNGITIPIIEKDQDNNYFIDQEFSLFHPMINYLRNKANITGKYPNLDSPNNDDLEREGNTIQDFYRMVEYYGMTNEIYPTKLEVHSNNTGGSSLEEDTDSAVEFIGDNSSKKEVIAQEWTTFQLVDNGNHGRRVKNYEIKLGENVKRIQIGWKYTNNDIKFNSKRRNTGTGVGDINFTYALDLTRSVYLINGKSDPLPAPFDYQKGTIIRSENYGQIWYVDDEIVYSTSNDKWEAITSDRSNLEGMCPMISIKGGMEITCIELEE